MKKNYILFMDSGIGGLSILAEHFKNNLSAFDYIYFADTKNMPYGSHSKAFLQKTLKQTIDNFCKKYSIKLIVLACNTATASCIDFLRQNYPDLKFIGTEPAINLASKMGYSNILAITTPLTKTQEKFISLKTRINKNTLVYADKNLAKLIETAYVTPSFLAYAKLLKSITKIARLSSKFDCLVLGCTHYPLAITAFNKFVKIPIFDSAQGVSRQICVTLKSYSAEKTTKSSIIFTNSNRDFNINQKNKKIFNQILANKQSL